MFDFENLQVYTKSKLLNQDVVRFIKSTKYLDREIKDQLRRASLSIILNIAEGSGKFTMPDKRNFYIRARGSTYECVSIFDVLKDENTIEESEYKNFYFKYEELSKMLLGLINSQK